VRIRINSFIGEAKRVTPRLLDASQAQVAENCKLERGSLKPFYDYSSSVTLTALSNLQMIHPISSLFWFTATTETDVVEAPVYSSGNRVYYTDGTKPRKTNYTLASNAGAKTFGTANTSYYLGVPYPASALTATAKGTPGTNIVGYVCYVYTYVTSWGEEGAPSDASNIVAVYEDQYVELGNFITSVPADYNIVGYRIYRLNTGTSGSEYQLMDTIMGVSGTYITPAEVIANSDVWDDKDTGDGEMVDDDDLGAVITCSLYEEPPADLVGLIPLSNGCFAGFRSNKVYVSEPFQPQAWPSDYSFTTAHNVVALGHYGTTIVVATEEKPYLLQGYDPQSMTKVALPDPQACLNKRSMVSGDGFCIYASPDGLYMVADSGNQLVTNGVFTRDQWRDLCSTNTSSPTTTYDKDIIGFLYNNKYFGFFEGYSTGFIIDFESQTQSYVKIDLGTGYLVYGGYVDHLTDTLYLLVKNSSTYYIYKWEGDLTDYLAYDWKSKVFIPGPVMSFGAAKVNGSFTAGSTGTGTISSSSTAVTGSMTVFTTELKVGYFIGAGTEFREVTAITDNTHLTLSTAFTSNLSASAFTIYRTGFKYYVDGTLTHIQGIGSDEPFRIPPTRGREVEFGLRGYEEAFDMTVAPTMIELMTDDSED